MADVKVEAHQPTINAGPLQKATRHVARMSRLYQAIAQRDPRNPPEAVLREEIEILGGELKRLGLPVPTSHQEAADMWVKYDPDNPHAHHQAAHDEMGRAHGDS